MSRYQVDRDMQEHLERADGVLARYRQNHQHVLVEDVKARAGARAAIEKELRRWGRPAETVPPLVDRYSEIKEDALGRPVMFSFKSGYRCPDLATFAGDRPVMLAGDAYPVTVVTLAECKKCPEYRPATWGRKQRCAMWETERLAWIRGAS